MIEKENMQTNNNSNFISVKPNTINLRQTILLWIMLIILFNIVYFIVFALFPSNTIKAIAKCVICVSFLLILKYLIERITNSSFKEYVAIKKSSFKNLVLWVSIFIIFIITKIIIYKFLPDGLIMSINDYNKLYNFDTVYVPVLFVRICFVVPIYEEIFYRGFLFKGIQNSKLGNSGAVILTSFLFLIGHFHYNIITIIYVFFAAFLFGLCRLYTKSIIIPIIIHMSYNLYALISFFQEFQN